MQRHYSEKKRIVIALGHNALGTTLPEQQEAAGRTAAAVAGFIQRGYEVAITHSNGPQVGMIHQAMNDFGEHSDVYTKAPMSVCSAMSQGYIGYDLQQAIRSEFLKRGMDCSVCTILTQVVVDAYDEAFYRPGKHIGKVLSSEEARSEEAEGHRVTPVEGGFRRIVAAPRPERILEIDAIRALLDAGQVVIACGGGGIPVLLQGDRFKGASAVVEKDTAAGLLADQVDADMLVILTGVEKVCRYFGTAREEPIDYLSVGEAREMMKEGVFGINTMLPKIAAAVDFIGDSPHRKVLITKLDTADKETPPPLGRRQVVAGMGSSPAAKPASKEMPPPFGRRQVVAGMGSSPAAKPASKEMPPPLGRRQVVAGMGSSPAAKPAPLDLDVVRGTMIGYDS